MAELADRAAERLADVPENTRRAYEADWADWSRWCDTHGLAVIPVASETAVLYVEHLISLGRAPSTIDRRLGTFGRAHRLRGLDRPDMRDARQVLAHYRDQRAADGKRTRRAKALTLDDIDALLAAMRDDDVATARDRAMILLGFATAARRSELAALRWTDIDEHAEGLLIAIWRAKVRRLDEVPVPRSPNPDRCPVLALSHYREALADQAEESVFLRIDKSGNVGRTASGRGSAESGALSPGAIAGILKRRGLAAGLPVNRLSGHSLRRGLATQSRLAGADIVAVARHGGWSENSAVLAAYFDDADKWSKNVLDGVL